MRTFTHIFVALLGMIILISSGCGDGASHPDEKRESSIEQKRRSTELGVVLSPLNPIIKLEESIATVNGVQIKREDYDRWLVLRARDYCVANKLNFSKRNKKMQEYIWDTRAVALKDLIRRELCREEFERRSLVVSNDVLVAFQKRFMKRIRRPKESFDEYVRKLPRLDGEELRRQVFADARDEVLLRSWATNGMMSVSALEVTNHIAYVKNYNKAVEAKNADSKKRAAAAKAEILAGASFCQVATNRADIFIDQAEFWDLAEIDEFEPDEDIFKFLASAKQGDISDPLDFDDGIGLAGVLGVESVTNDDGKVSCQYALVRCMFNGYDMLEEDSDFESVRKSLLEEKLKSARQALVVELSKSAKIEFPFGDSLFMRKKQGKIRKTTKNQISRKKKRPIRPLPEKSKPLPNQGGISQAENVPAKEA